MIEICASTPGVLRKRVFEGKRAAQAITRQFEIGIAKREPVQRKRGKGLAIEQFVRDKTAGEHITFEIQRRLMPGALTRSFSQSVKVYWRLIVSPVVHAIEIVQQIGHIPHGIRAVKAERCQRGIGLQ